MKARMLLLLTMLLTTCYCFGQRMELSTNGIGISYFVLPNSLLKDTSGKFGYSTFDINARITLFNTLKKQAWKTKSDSIHTAHFYETSLRADFGVMPANIDFIGISRNFYHSSLGIGTNFRNNKNIFSATVNIGMAADGTVIENNDIKYRFSGSFIVSHIHSVNTIYQYGVVCTYAYGAPFPLPVLGINKRLSASGKWTLSALLPISLKLTDKINDKSNLLFSIQPVGNRFQIAGQNTFNTTSSYNYMQLRQLELKSEYSYKISKYFSANIDAGLLFARKLKFTDANNAKTTLCQENIQHGSAFSFSLKYALPGKKAANIQGSMNESN